MGVNEDKSFLKFSIIFHFGHTKKEFVAKAVNSFLHLFYSILAGELCQNGKGTGLLLRVISERKQQKSKQAHQKPEESARLFPKESFVIPPAW